MNREKIKSYKDLIVWQKAHQNTLKVIPFVMGLPRHYIFREIGSQLFRASASIGANIAEGHSSYRGEEYKRFLEYAYRSAIEVDNWCQLLEDSKELNKQINQQMLAEIKALNIEVIKLLTNLMKSLIK